MNEMEDLFRQLQEAAISEEAHSKFLALLALPENEARAKEMLDAIAAGVEKKPTGKLLTSWELESIRDSIYLADRRGYPAHATEMQDGRVYSMYWSLSKIAAAVILLIGIAVFFWSITDRKVQSLVENTDGLPKDISPGGDRAMLTLADGSTITLDSAANGELAKQDGAAIIKLASGQIAYKPGNSPQANPAWNTMTTPKGGQYQVTLPDGTRVWLNAASSISYPTAFTGKKRVVKIKGEVYFEVAKNKQMPFVVDIEGKSMVEVLGTSFNINSYPDEESIETTLLEGSVKVSSAADQKVLVAGQQARMYAALNNGKAAGQTQSDKNKIQSIFVNSNADMEQVMAWKNGLFNFTNADLPTVMRQIERWYDVQVRYDQEPPVVKFQGKLKRGVKLSTVLNWFADLGIKTSLDGKILIVQ